MSENVRQFVSKLVSAEALDSAKDFCLANGKSLAAATGAAVALLYAARAYYRVYRLPPGPLGLPILGRLPWLDLKHLEESQEKMRHQYGGIYSYRMGSRLMIVVSSYELLKEMLSEDVFSGRQLPPAAQRTAQDCGILFVEGRVWSEQRRVSLRVLRDFGFARTESVEFINEEICILMEKLEQQPTEVKVIDHFNALTNSVIAMLVFGRRYANEDKRYEKFLENSKFLFDVGLLSELPFLFPYLSKLLSLLPMTRKIVKTVQDIQTFIEEEITKREALISSDADAEGTCLCDAYIIERRNAEAKGDFETFKKFQLVRVSMELFVAGTDTTAKTLEWLMIHMAAFPEAQDNVQAEIHQVAGTERQPQLSDKAQLHYTQAVIDESMRFASLAPNAISHRAIKDTYFRGYLIPADAAIVPFLYGLHRNSKYWKRPHTFYPGHFLTEDGRYAPSKMLEPFCVGKRACPGESLAKLEIFLTFTAIMQRYRVRFSRDYETKVDDILRGVCGLARDAGENRLDFVRL
ncbi:hypothetical protein BOX15_Mlig009966g3 [Macrostomum lignano]|uniref:Cytochrome P450 n=1 Tax=Macrostomum lignano TaxID=282301 RepID=A0A267FQE9_9PLAT|nr:hypothetical protein BOX15_Mlig009966g3 [Macrostomum lignano]